MKIIEYLPKFERSAMLIRHLTQATSLMSWINQQTIDVSWIAKCQRDSLIRQAHFSTAIEGNPLTLQEVAALAAGKEIIASNQARLEVLNYFAALRLIWSKLSARITERQLLHLHKVLTKGVLQPGEIGTYKTRPNAIFGNGRMIYKPPLPEVAPMLTQALLNWINSDSQKEHPIVVAAIAHHRLVSIHPFADGNGRVSRLIESWILFNRSFDSQHIFALDEFFEIDRSRYYREIQDARDNGDDLSYWITYVAEGVVETLQKTKVRIQALGASASTTKISLNSKQERILHILSQQPCASGSDLAKKLGIGRSFLSKLLKILIDYGLIIRDGSTKSASYRLPDVEEAQSLPLGQSPSPEGEGL